MKTKITTRQLAFSAIIIAIDVILTRVISINTNIMKISLGFSALVVTALLFTPLWTALVASLGDIVGAIMFPTGAFNPAFTATAFLTGLIFGVCLNKEKPGILRCVIAALLNSIIVSYLINTALISFFYGSPFTGLLKVRAIQLLINIPVQSVVTIAIVKSGVIQKFKQKYL